MYDVNYKNKSNRNPCNLLILCWFWIVKLFRVSQFRVLFCWIKTRPAKSGQLHPVVGNCVRLLARYQFIRVVLETIPKAGRSIAVIRGGLNGKDGTDFLERVQTRAGVVLLDVLDPTHLEACSVYKQNPSTPRSGGGAHVCSEVSWYVW